MLFNSYEFILLFLPASLVGYLYLNAKLDRRISILWLISASLFFYAWWNPAYLALLIGSMLFNYGIGILLVSRNRPFHRKSILVAGICANLGALAYFKYANFFVDNINAIFGSGWNLEQIILPLAISFFTFQQITYLVDAYQQDTREYNFLQYALFVSFFPQLIAGPIVHHKEMMPQFFREAAAKFDYQYIAVGFSIFFLGLFKKVVIADSLSPYVAETFNATSQGNLLSLFDAWFGVLAYTFQLYFDFSGYSDMAIGLAFMFGIRLPLNFNSPYKAYSIIEFWQRWHMTLSRFLKDYVYIPLGGNRKGEPRRYLNLLLTMLIGGLWHGAGWTFVIWGGMHGIMLAINHAWRSLCKWRQLYFTDSAWFRFFSRLMTFLLVALTWVYFRSDNLDSANLMMQSLFGAGGVYWPEENIDHYGLMATVLPAIGIGFSYVPYFNGTDHLLLLTALLIMVWKMPNLHEIFHEYSAVTVSPGGAAISWKPSRAWLAFMIVVALVSILKLGQVSEFLYFQF